VTAALCRLRVAPIPVRAIGAILVLLVARPARAQSTQDASPPSPPDAGSPTPDAASPAPDAASPPPAGNAAPLTGAAAASTRTIVPPKLVTFVQAEIPPSEAAAGRGATVLLQIAIDPAGKVASVGVLESATPAFDAAAVAAAKQFVFEPATVDGKPIPVKITYRYQFTMTEKRIVKQTADFVGTVRDRSSKEPIANVRIALDTGQETVTDEQGRFSILDVQPGEHGVTLSGESVATVGTTETFEAGKRLDATYDVAKKKSGAGEEEEEEIVVYAARLKKQVVSTEVQAAQAQKVPGTQGDVLKVVENLPGVARAAVGSGALVVWGAAPQDTRVYVDGIHVPRLYHDGGYRSILPSAFVKSVELIPGGYGGEYGRGLGGIVTVSMRPLDDDGFHGSVGADVIDASTDVRARVGRGMHVAVGARKSYLDTVLTAVTSADVGNYVPIPRYWDGQARVVFDLAPHETLGLGTLASSDRIAHALINPDPSLTTRQTAATDFQRFFARYEKRLPDASVITVVPWLGFDSTSLVNVFGSTPTDVENDSTLIGLRAGWHGPLVGEVRGNVGLDAEAVLSELHRSGSIGAPPREGDKFTFGQPPPSEVDTDKWKTTIMALGVFAEADAPLFADRLHLVPGVRFEPFLVATNKTRPETAKTGPMTAVGYSRHEDAIEPRLSVRYAAAPRVKIKAAFGEYHQTAQPEELSAAFGTPKLVMSTAQQYLVGSTFELTDSLSVECTAFLTTSQDLVVRSEAPSPFLAQALQQTGIGRSYGTQFLLRQQQLGRFFGWVSYTIMRSQRKDSPDQDWRLFDYDQTHVFTALGSYDLGHGFEVGARFRYATGYPRTPVLGSYYDARTNAYEPIFGVHNGTRIPPFAALDLRGTKRFKWGRMQGECYLDLQNVTSNQNSEEIVYNTTYVQRGYITGMPILPVLGMRLTW
jgi:TonB family protein